jgi:hypothetical protein
MIGVTAQTWNNRNQFCAPVVMLTPHWANPAARHCPAFPAQCMERMHQEWSRQI